MNIRDFWGKLDPIAIIGIIVFIAMIIILFVLLTVTQRLAAREYVNAYEEHSEALANQRDILRQRRQTQTEEILRSPERDSIASSDHRPRLSQASASRQSFVDPYSVPPRKPVPNRQSRDTLELDDMRRHRSLMSSAFYPAIPMQHRPPNHRSRQHRPRQHPPLFFQRPGYQPVPIFDLVGDATSPGTK